MFYPNRRRRPVSEDPYLDPDVIAAKYQSGRSTMFEVQLALAEMGEQNSLTPASVVQYLYYSGPGRQPLGCPSAEDFVLSEGLEWIQASKLPDLIDRVRLYNPKTTNYNKLIGAELIKDAELVRVEANGFSMVCSVSHSMVLDLRNETIRAIGKCSAGDRIFVICIINGFYHICNAVVDRIVPLGKGSVVSIELENEHLYVSGSNKKTGFIAHNIKPVADE